MEDKTTYSIPKRQANSILVALIGLVGVVATSYYSDRPSVIVDAPDRFTGADWHKGKALIMKSLNDYKEKDEDRMDMCRKRITILERNIFYLEEKIQ